MKTQNILTITLLAILSLNSVALINNLPNQITIQNNPTDFYFNVTNNENTQRSIEIQMNSLTEHKFLEKPTILNANETKTVTIRIFPKKELTGKNTLAKITAKTSTNTAEKTINIFFSEQKNCPLNITTTLLTTKQDNQPAFTILTEISNQKNETEKFRIKKINNIPNDWIIETENTNLINAFETRIIKTKIFPQSSFEGKIELVFECSQTEEKRSHSISFKKENNQQNNSLTGLLTGIQTQTGILNLSLAIIAAVLLIMFISRLVKITAQGQQKDTNLKLAKNKTETKTKHNSTNQKPQTTNKKLEQLKQLISKEAKK